MFIPIFPFPLAPATHWIEWFEALLSNEHLLVRCIPGIELPENATSILLDFGTVIAFRATQDPFSFESEKDSKSLPRENGRALTSLIMKSTDSDWVKQASDLYPAPIFHYILVSAQDQILEILTRGIDPIVTLEHRDSEPNPEPRMFYVS